MKINQKLMDAIKEIQGNSISPPISFVIEHLCELLRNEASQSAQDDTALQSRISDEIRLLQDTATKIDNGEVI